MRVALVCPYAWDAAGGVQVHVADLARHLRRRGHDVLVLAPGRGAPLPRVGGPVVRVRYRGTVAPIAPSPHAIAGLRRTFQRWRPDVVHVHEPFTPSASMWATLASPAPVVATFHAHLDRSRVFDAAAPVLRAVARRISISIAVSDAAAGFLRRSMPSIEPVVIPNGVDVASFEEADPADLPDGRRIAWVHRLDPQKGLAVALEAFGRALEGVPEARLIVAGDGPDRSLLATAVPAVRARITPLGAIAHARVAPILRACEVAIAPATGQESFGIALVEAMASGTPVVASDIAGYREVVRDRVDGLLVPPGDAGALGAAIGEVLTDPGLARSLTEGARARAATYDWSVVADRLVAAYAEARGSSPPLR